MFESWVELSRAHNGVQTSAVEVGRVKSRK